METTPFIEAKQFEEQNNFAAAAEKYEQAIKLGIGDQALAYQGLGRALTRLGNLDEALRACQKALAINSDLPLANGVLGYIYLQQNRHNLAEQQLLTALRLEPDNCTTLANLAIVYSKSKRYEEATAVVEKCLKIQPDQWDYQKILLVLYAQQINFKRATHQYLRMVRGKPTTLKLFPLGIALYLNMVALAFRRLNIFVRLGVILGFLLVAWLAPHVIKITIGFLLSTYVVFTFIMSLVSLLFVSYGRHISLGWFTWSIALSAIILFYWFIVFAAS